MPKPRNKKVEIGKALRGFVTGNSFHTGRLIDILNDGTLEYDAKNDVYLLPDGEPIGTGGSGVSNQLWRPAVDIEGNLTWARSTSTVIPTPQNIKGAPGKDGKDGKDGIDGETPELQMDDMILQYRYPKSSSLWKDLFDFTKIEIDLSLAIESF